VFAVQAAVLKTRVAFNNALMDAMPQLSKHYRSPQEFSVKVESQATMDLASQLGNSKVVSPSCIGDKKPVVDLVQNLKQKLIDGWKDKCVAVFTPFTKAITVIVGILASPQDGLALLAEFATGEALTFKQLQGLPMNDDCSRMLALDFCDTVPAYKGLLEFFGVDKLTLDAETPRLNDILIAIVVHPFSCAFITYTCSFASLDCKLALSYCSV